MTNPSPCEAIPICLNPNLCHAGPNALFERATSKRHSHNEWRALRTTILLACAALYACASDGIVAAGKHFAKAEELIQASDWSGSMAEYTAGCGLLAAEKDRTKCYARGNAIYERLAGISATPGIVEPSSPVALTESPIVARAQDESAYSLVAPVESPDLLFVHGDPQPTAFAVIVGIEHYDGLPAPTGALRDATRFAALARYTLGIPIDHTTFLPDDKATMAGIERAIEWARTSVRRRGRIYFYYSGHGAPDASSGTAYVVPYDGDPQYLAQTALPLSKLIRQLGESPADDVIAIFDSCFSGAGGRSVVALGTRPLVRVKEKPATPRSKNTHIVVFTAASNAEISGPTAVGDQGLFSRYVVDGLGTAQADADGDGAISIAELFAWVTPRVTREAQEQHRDQHPSLGLSAGIAKGEDLFVAWGLAKK